MKLYQIITRSEPSIVQKKEIFRTFYVVANNHIDAIDKVRMVDNNANINTSIIHSLIQYADEDSNNNYDTLIT